MEIEITDLTNPQKQIPLWAVILIGLLVLFFGFSALGQTYTAHNQDGSPVILSWLAWQMALAERDFQEELAQLRGEADGIVELLNDDTPDPVSAQVTADRIARQYQTGQDALAYQRQAVIEAVQFVRDYTVGVSSYEDASQAVEAMLETLQPTNKTDPRPYRGFFPLMTNQPGE